MQGNLKSKLVRRQKSKRKIILFGVDKLYGVRPSVASNWGSSVEVRDTTLIYKR